MCVIIQPLTSNVILVIKCVFIKECVKFLFFLFVAHLLSHIFIVFLLYTSAKVCGHIGMTQLCVKIIKFAVFRCDVSVQRMPAVTSL